MVNRQTDLLIIAYLVSQLGGQATVPMDFEYGSLEIAEVWDRDRELGTLKVTVKPYPGRQLGKANSGTNGNE